MGRGEGGGGAGGGGLRGGGVGRMGGGGLNRGRGRLGLYGLSRSHHCTAMGAELRAVGDIAAAMGAKHRSDSSIKKILKSKGVFCYLL